MGEHTEYNCPFCDMPFNSRQALYYHKKNVCDQNPANKKPEPAKEPAGEVPPQVQNDDDRFEVIRKNREEYEKEMGTEIPDPFNDDKDVDVVVAPETLDDQSILIIIILIVVAVCVGGLYLFREGISKMLHRGGKPPIRPGVVPA